MTGFVEAFAVVALLLGSSVVNFWLSRHRSFGQRWVCACVITNVDEIFKSGHVLSWLRQIKTVVAAKPFK
ncbi:hypothetical protein V5799_021606 [Amblyomma americanum]|uniref:Uncharacterized protein n=1 Tax=Amblyomma americanum TaxID=6943 RepID=A0AAQ4FPR2_AMBAM